MNKANLGKAFETLVNTTNHMYRLRGDALIIKTDAEWKVLFKNRGGYRVPIKAWKQQKGFVDYIGAVKGGIPICFDAKSTELKTRFPLSNVADHQVEKMRDFEKMGGISFLLVHFEQKDETYILTMRDLETFWTDAKMGGRKSIPYTFFASRCEKVKCQNGLKIDYLASLRLPNKE